MLSGRALLDRLRIVRDRRRNKKNVVIIGTNSRALAFGEKIHTRAEPGYILEGFVDDTAGSGQIGTTGYPLLTDLRGFESLIWRKPVDEVFIALPPEQLYARLPQIEAICKDQGIAVRFLSDRSPTPSARTRTTLIGGQSVVTVSDVTNRPLPLAIKRLSDIVASIVALLLLAPLMLLVALLIKVTCPGPVFFVQERVGIRKHPFRLYKFRTMVPDAEKRIHEIEGLNEVQGPVFKIWNDPRVTPVGRFLRRTSIDELPQLLNVLKGDMSLVGPRPLAIRDYLGMGPDSHRRRFKVRPGITCLWQCNGRSNVLFDQWMKMDLEYIDNWSLMLDLKILFKTIPAVLRGSGAA